MASGRSWNAMRPETIQKRVSSPDAGPANGPAAISGRNSVGKSNNRVYQNGISPLRGLRGRRSAIDVSGILGVVKRHVMLFPPISARNWYMK